MNEMSTRRLFKFSLKSKQSVKELRFEYLLYFDGFLQNPAHHLGDGEVL